MATRQAETDLMTTVLDRADVGYVLVAADASLVYANTRARQAMAVAFPDEGESVMGPDGRDVEAAEVFDGSGNPLAGPGRPSTRLAQGEEFTDVRLWIGPAGARQLMSLSGRLLVPGDRFGGGIISIVDITEQDRAQRLRESFHQTIAHELRTPLMALDTHLCMLSDVDDLPEEAQDILPALSRGTRRLKRLASQLIGETTGRSFAHEATMGPVDLARLVRETYLDLQEDAECDVEFVRNPPGPAFIEADEAMVARAVRELLRQSCSQVPPEGLVSIGISRTESCVQLSVHDNGPGIDSSQHLAIFEPTPEMLEPEGHLGGLPYVKAAAAIHGGRIDIDSALARGCTYILSLPVSRP